jgi:hypothetical protein
MVTPGMTPLSDGRSHWRRAADLPLWALSHMAPWALTVIFPAAPRLNCVTRRSKALVDDLLFAVGGVCFDMASH